MQLASLMFRATLGAAALALCLGAAAGYVDDILLERDTPYVPSPPDVVERMLDMVDIKPGEFVVDLGAGDGRIAIAAGRLGARAFGVELGPTRQAEQPTPPRQASATASASR